MIHITTNSDIDLVLEIVKPCVKHKTYYNILQ